MGKIDRFEFGKNSYGDKVYSYRLSNNEGISIHCLSYGACLQKFLCPGKSGVQDDIVLGFDSISEYESKANQNFGGTIGRVAGRIEGASFKLKDKTYNLTKNWNGHHLHGGSNRPLDRVIWDAQDASEGDLSRVIFTYLSPHGEEAYPGNLAIQITYSLNHQNEMTIDFHATTDQDTPVNLTNHSYWNLKGAGNGDILNHSLEIKSHEYLTTNQDLIPTGEVKSIRRNDPLNFSQRKLLKKDFDEILSRYPLYKGIDHTFILEPHSANKVVLSEATSKRSLHINTSLPCLQVYSGNHLFRQKGKGQLTYQPYGGIALECQLYPNAINQNNFPSCILSPEKPYEHFIKFSLLTKT